MTDPDRDLARLLDRLAADAPPPPDARRLQGRQRQLRRRRAALAGGLVLGAAALAATWRPEPTATGTPALAQPAPRMPSPPPALDPGMEQPALIAAISACLGLPADAELDLRKDDGVLQVAGATSVPLERLRRLDGLLARIAGLDLRFSPGARPRLRLLLATTSI